MRLYGSDHKAITDLWRDRPGADAPARGKGRQSTDVAHARRIQPSTASRPVALEARRVAQGAGAGAPGSHWLGLGFIESWRSEELRCVHASQLGKDVRQMYGARRCERICVAKSRYGGW